MKLATDQSSPSAVSSQLQELLVIEAQKQRFQALVHSLTELCWDTCMDNPGSRIHDKTRKCMVNCVDRFLDTTVFVENQMKVVQ